MKLKITASTVVVLGALACEARAFFPITPVHPNGGQPVAIVFDNARVPKRYKNISFMPEAFRARLNRMPVQPSLNHHSFKILLSAEWMLQGAKRDKSIKISPKKMVAEFDTLRGYYPWEVQEVSGKSPGLRKAKPFWLKPGVPVKKNFVIVPGLGWGPEAAAGLRDGMKVTGHLSIKAGRFLGRAALPLVTRLAISR